MVGVLEERGVDLHLALERRFELGVDLVPGRDFLVSRRELRIGRDETELLLHAEGHLALLVPAVRELALVFVDPLLGHMVRRMGGTGCEVHEERLVRQQRFLLAAPVDRLVDQILGQVVALFGRLGRRNRRRALIQRRIPLVGLATDEAIEVFEPSATGRPGVERTGRTGLPHRNLVTLSELRRRVPVELERLGQRRLVVGQHRAVARRAGGDLGDAAHAHRMVVAPGEQRLARGRTQRRGVESRELQTALGELFEVGRVARSAKGAGRTKADVVEQDHQHVGRTLGRPHLADRRKTRTRIARVVDGGPRSLHIGNGKNGALQMVLITHGASPLVA